MALLESLWLFIAFPQSALTMARNSRGVLPSEGIELRDEGGRRNHCHKCGGRLFRPSSALSFPSSLSPLLSFLITLDRFAKKYCRCCRRRRPRRCRRPNGKQCDRRNVHVTSAKFSEFQPPCNCQTNPACLYYHPLWPANPIPSLVRTSPFHAPCAFRPTDRRRSWVRSFGSSRLPSYEGGGRQEKWAGRAKEVKKE